MDVGVRAEELFATGHFCAEAVLQALAEKLGMQSDIIPQIASGFCSGMSRSSETCGAATGAVMGLGLAFGRKQPNKSDQSREEMQACYSFSQEFLDQFTKAFGSANCLELTGCDFSTPEGQLRFKKVKGIEKCAVYVREAANMAAAIMDEELGTE